MGTEAVQPRDRVTDAVQEKIEQALRDNTANGEADWFGLVSDLTDAALAAVDEMVEEAAKVADSYGRVWTARPGPAIANTIAAKIRALKDRG